MIKSWRMSIGDGENNTYRIFVENLKESNLLEDLGIDGMILI
jgi:hypothetical protein